MKFYSEILKKLFDSEADLVAAESRDAQLKAEEQEKKNKISAEKKIAATKVQQAAEAYEEALDKYNEEKKNALKILDDAESEAAKIINKANEEAEKIMNEAEENLRKAKFTKFNAVAEFNKAYGPYKTVLTPEDAEKEYNRFISDVDGWVNKLTRFF